MNERVKSDPRLAPLPVDANPDLKEAFQSNIRNLGFVPNSTLIMQRKPMLVKAFAQLSAAVWDPAGEVNLGFRRLVAHVASRAHGCHY